MNNCYECLHYDVCIKWKKPALYGVTRKVGCVDHFMPKAADEIAYGYWEQLDDVDYKCSECGFRFTSSDPISMFKHCRCGAKMRR